MKNLLFSALLLLGYVLPAHAQQRCMAAVDVQTKAEVDAICVGQQVRFIDCSGTLMKEVYYDFDLQGEHKNFTDTTSFHTFTVPGTHTVSQFARDRQGIDAFFTRTFEVKPLPLAPTQTPEIKSLVGAAEPAPGAFTLVLDNLQAGYPYILEVAASASSIFIPLDTLRPSATGTSTYLHQLTEVGVAPCFRLRATGFCGGSPDVVSETLCVLSLTGQAQDKANGLSWAPFIGTGLSGYQLLRNNQNLLPNPIAPTEFLDELVACGRTYCYQVVAQLAGGRSSSSLPLCLTVTSTTPPQPGTLHSTFANQNQVVVMLRVPPEETVQEMAVQRSLDNGPFAEIHRGTSTDFTDGTVSDLAQSVCYQAVYQDSCGLSSPLSFVSCPMILKAELLPDNTTRLEWTPWRNLNTGQPDADQVYTVELVDPNGTVYARPGVVRSVQTFTDPSPSQDFQILRYRISVFDQTGEILSQSNIVSLERPFQVSVPNAFTPNNDGLNDVFEVKGRFVSTFRMTVYNTWGQLVFQSIDPKRGWDGRVNGKEAPVGTYAFTVEATDDTGKKFTKTGTLSLLR